MKRKAALFLLTALLSLAQAQGVRSLGMGGVALPGPSYAHLNPAYAGFPDRFGREGFRLSLGLLRLLPPFPETSPLNYWSNFQTFQDRFDLVSFYDQMAHLDTFLINPSRSPEEVVFRIRKDGLSITDGAGNPLRLRLSQGTDPGQATPLVPGATRFLSISLAPGAYLDLGVFAGVQGVRVSPSPSLERALTGDLEECRNNPEACRLEVQGAASSGISLGLGLVLPLDLSGLGLEMGGVERVQLGFRGEGFYGLAYAEGEASVHPVFDQEGNPSSAKYAYRYFLAYPGQGYGFGLRGDLGVALGGQNWAIGLGVQNLLGFAQWQGEEVQGDGESETRGPAGRTSPLANPAFFLNGAYRLPLEAGSLLLAGDLRFGALAPAFHLGVEYGLGPLALRTGVGYEGGLRFGLGAGMGLGGVALDLALTTHQALLDGSTVYGLALAVGF